MTLGMAEEPKDLLGGRASTLALLRIHRKLVDPFPLHGQTQFAFNKRPDQAAGLAIIRL